MSSPIQTILVPTDFSQAAQQALAYAVKLAEALQAKLSVVHVVEPIAYPAEWLESAISLQSIEQAIVQNAHKALNQLLQETVQGRVPVEGHILFGYPPDAILTFAREHAVDLICLAPHGHSLIERLLLGSTTEKIVRNATCSVLVYRVKEPQASSQEGTVSGNGR